MNETRGTRVLLSDPVSAIPQLALPLAVAIFVQNLNGVTDAMWAAWLGADALGGLGLAYPLYASIVGIGSGLAIGVAAAEARAVGLGDREGASGYAAQSFTISLVISVALAIPLVIFAVPLMDAFGSGAASREAVDYGMPFFSFGFFIIASAVMSGILRGEGAAKESMAIQVIGAATNIVLDPVLMYGLDMGVAGAGWATVIAGAVSLLLGLSFYARKKMFIVLRPRGMIPSARMSKEILYVGAPEAAELATMSLINIPMNFIIVGVGGASAVGFYTSAWRIAYLVLIPAQAISGAIVSVCSTEFARGRGDLVQRAFSFGTRISLKQTTILAVVMAVLSYPLAMVFTASSSMDPYRGEMCILIILLALMLPVMSQVFVGSAYLQALKHSEIGFLSSFIRNLIMVSGYFVAAELFGVTMGIWVACSAIEIFGGTMMWLFARKYVRAFVSAHPCAPA